jgi:hypothetical protein
VRQPVTTDRTIDAARDPLQILRQVVLGLDTSKLTSGYCVRRAP